MVFVLQGMEGRKMVLSIFTPTYNRSELLKRAYRSLCEQTNHNFEWIIIDDGSTDNTSQVVQAMIAEKKIVIQYYRQENGGKHTAFNYAADIARGELLLCLDSDDWMERKAVDNIISCAPNVLDSDYGMMAYKRDTSGKMLCNDLPDVHRGMFGYGQEFGSVGEYAVIYKTKVLKSYPFPVFEGEKFLTEAVHFDYIELQGYTLCPLPQVVQVCEYQVDGLTQNLYRIMLANPQGYQMYHAQRINLANTLAGRIRHAVCYHAFRLMTKDKRKTYRGKHTMIVRLAAFPGVAAKFYYELKKRG